MDNSNNNLVNNQNSNPVNDNTQPTTDYNSMQPQSNPLGVVSDTPASSPMDNSVVDALAGTPTEDSTPDETPAPMPQTPVSETPITESSTSETSTPATDTVQGILDSLPADNTTTPEQSPVTESAPSMTQPETSSDVDIDGKPIIGSIPPVEDSTSDVFASAAPVEESTEPAPTKEEVPTPDTSLNLNEPLNTVAQSSVAQEEAMPSEEVVSTLDETEKSEKGGSAVVIILVVIILLLLAGIGYFGYQIFFA